MSDSDDINKPDGMDIAVRAGCGVMLAIPLATSMLLGLRYFSWWAWGALVVVIVLFAIRGGDAFFESFDRWTD